MKRKLLTGLPMLSIIGVAVLTLNAALSGGWSQISNDSKQGMSLLVATVIFLATASCSLLGAVREGQYQDAPPTELITNGLMNLALLIMAMTATVLNYDVPQTLLAAAGIMLLGDFMFWIVEFQPA